MKNQATALKPPTRIIEMRPIAQPVRAESIKQTSEHTNGYIIIPTSGTFHFVQFDDLLRLEADGNCTRIFLSNGKNILVTKSLKSVCQKLPPEQFIRVHQSHVINHAHIRVIYRLEEIELIDGTRIGISRNRKKEIKTWLVNNRLF